MNKNITKSGQFVKKKGNNDNLAEIDRLCLSWSFDLTH